MNYDEITSPTECRMIIAVADIAGFAHIFQTMSNREMFDMLDEFYELVGDVTEDAGGKVVKFGGDAALIVFPENTANQAVEALRSLKTRADGWLSQLDPSAQVYVKAHVGSVVCGPLGTAKEKRFDVIGAPVMELYMSPSEDFVLSPELQRAIASD